MFSDPHTGHRGPFFILIPLLLGSNMVRDSVIFDSYITCHERRIISQLMLQNKTWDKPINIVKLFTNGKAFYNRELVDVYMGGCLKASKSTGWKAYLSCFPCFKEI
jgi:hypothetical protein